MNKIDRVLRKRARAADRRATQNRREYVKAKTQRIQAFKAAIDREATRIANMLDDAYWEQHAELKEIGWRRKRACVRLVYLSHIHMNTIVIWLCVNGKVYEELPHMWYTLKRYSPLDVNESELNLLDALQVVQSVDDISRHHER